MSRLAARRILLGITGGIAAYKCCELVRQLRREGAEVQVLMTPAAAAFVTPLSLQAVSGRPVRTDLLDPSAEAAMGHIELARWGEVLLVAPASADALARLAQGHANDLLSTCYLAFDGPKFLAPAMNQAMWRAPATGRNVAQLEADGATVLGPASGSQACGDEGPGRMIEPADLVQALEAWATARGDSSPSPWAGRHVVITAGPTREALDPVRYLTNKSSGQQGFALAEAAVAAGARVTLITGPVSLPTPAGVTRIDVEAAQDMLTAAEAACADADLCVAVAAVADYRVAEVATQKLKRQDGVPLTLTLVPNPDIIATLAAQRGSRARPVLVAFAAETENVLAHARSKRSKKGVDFVVANDVSRADIGFNSEENCVTVLGPSGETALPKMSKRALSTQLLQEFASALTP
ncbi:MAG: bifunctional phosphopantothenoylcysteine decarboxylase/phosphopantothenate--cysteine ligase CoaBC [Pseudomonadales bacterium]|nr:bifunctional phosphopantothenoylcysteine decarboxylase/phosphopantothenate--cysteine ligase CoaBC [Pseudomonadales bacterium]MBL6807510.1 bifunctional phosphopantothenoylcysteine decarboxylase/phosphopantothenate--cysteine ligase CoaBC [Pseudomonadales bacterium]MDA0954621.1 bifunctional phosphopantothenoylcysteine decarboxylase/phosphopantothenate--cysteine ligase CoaBC [Pseudomonadota bacterium]